MKSPVGNEYRNGRYDDAVVSVMNADRIEKWRAHDDDHAFGSSVAASGFSNFDHCSSDDSCKSPMPHAALLDSWH